MDFTPLHGYARSVPEDVYFMRLVVVNAAIRAVNSGWKLDDVQRLSARVEELKALERGRKDVPPMPELYGAPEPGTGSQTTPEGRQSPPASLEGAPVGLPAGAAAPDTLPPLEAVVPADGGARA